MKPKRSKRLCRDDLMRRSDCDFCGAEGYPFPAYSNCLQVHLCNSCWQSHSDLLDIRRPTPEALAEVCVTLELQTQGINAKATPCEELACERLTAAASGSKMLWEWAGGEGKEGEKNAKW